MEAVKNKGGRPTKAEQAAKGITETELKAAIRLLKRVHGPMVQSLIADIESPDLTLTQRIKLKFDLIKLLESLLKTNKYLLSSTESSPASVQDDDEDMRPIFKLAG